MNIFNTHLESATLNAVDAAMRAMEQAATSAIGEIPEDGTWSCDLAADVDEERKTFTVTTTFRKKEPK